MGATSKSTLSLRSGDGTIASFRRRLLIPVSSSRGGRVRRLREPDGGVPARGRIVLRIHGTLR